MTTVSLIILKENLVFLYFN